MNQGFRKRTQPNFLIASHSDQTQPLLVDVTGKLESVNQLALRFSEPYCLWGKRSPDTNFAEPVKRQPEGNYLGPNPQLYTSGVVDDVVLEYTDGSLIHEIVTDVSLNESFSEGNVTFAVSGDSRIQAVDVRVFLFAPGGEQASETIVRIQPKNGKFAAHLRVTVANPELWWPRGYGEQHLYTAEIALLLQGRVHQLEYRTIGFRRIEMPDKLLRFERLETCVKRLILTGITRHPPRMEATIQRIPAWKAQTGIRTCGLYLRSII